MMCHDQVHIVNHEGTMNQFTQQTFWFRVCNELTPMNTTNNAFQTANVYIK